MMEGENPLANAIRATFTRPSWAFLLLIFMGLAVLSIHITRNTIFQLGPISSQAGLERPGGPPSCSGLFEAPPPRKVVKSISEFGGVGDGRTSNTAAFRRAMEYMEKFRGTGGTQLNVPKGRWLTGSFNLTSDFTLFLEDGAVILGSQDPEEWPIIAPLPSYGRGRERLGGRHISLIHGNSLTNVVITGKDP
ncbi:UNVERIFIED_CONTAM: putative polygalacturonase [Sesamum angustifolium]|uniref:Polygalacturonase n=1 Tax=Sesamum angustifolium TaxID=2727405 RepID=A0AAW2NH72_9LAMI